MNNEDAEQEKENVIGRSWNYFHGRRTEKNCTQIVIFSHSGKDDGENKKAAC